MAILKKYTATFTPTTIKTKQVTDKGKILVSEVIYSISAYETANSSNTVSVDDQSLTFNYLTKNTSDASFIEIENVNDSVVQGWIASHFNTRELELNALLTYADNGFVSSIEDDIDLSNPYG
tara:strand:+ start:3363 stop:3728 length:366 start_codon:yes stop_codon:yes gene_type:complete